MSPFQAADEPYPRHLPSYWRERTYRRVWNQDRGPREGQKLDISTHSVHRQRIQGSEGWPNDQPLFDKTVTGWCHVRTLSRQNCQDEDDK